MNTDSPKEPWADQRVTAYVLGELDPTEAAAFEHQLERDPALAAAVQEAERITQRLKQWFASEPPLTLDPQRRHSIFGAIARQSENGDGASASAVSLPASFGQSHGPAVRWMALAAAIVLAVGTIGYQWLANTQAERRERVLALVESERDKSELAVAATPQQDEHARDQVLSKQPATEKLYEAAASRSATSSSRFSPQPLDGPKLNRFGAQATEAESLADGPPVATFFAEPTAEFNRSFQHVESAESADEAMLGRLPGVATAARESSSARSRSESQAAKLIAPPAALPSMAAEPLSMSADFASPTSEPMDNVSAGAPAENFETRQLRSPRGANVDVDGVDILDDGNQVASSMGRAPAEEHGIPAIQFFAESGSVVIHKAFGMPPIDAEGRHVNELPLIERQLRLDQGRGPGMSGDRFDPIIENPFKRVPEHPLSTFSIDVDTAAYSKVRQFLLESGQLPRPDVVRIEELVNYFDYDYPAPPAESPHPLAAAIEIAQCPWNTAHRLARIGVQARRVADQERPASNLVFLIDTSGSMNMPNRLPLVKQGLERLLDQLQPTDRVAIVVYAGSAGQVLDSTPASDVSPIRRALTRLHAGGSTNGGDGIRLAYQTARDHFIAGGINRVILCTDGDFNVGTTSQDELVQLVEQQSRGGIDLTVLGFGMGNHNDAMLEQISGRGNGNYAFIDNLQEAQRVLVERATSTLFTVARDVKIQVEFNPQHVSAYRLIGYENRMLAKEDFKDDTKDAGEVGAGHSVTALYELIPHEGNTDALPPVVDDLKYQTALVPTAAAESDEVLTVKIRYKPIDRDGRGVGGSAGESIPLEFPAKDSGAEFAQASESYRFASLVAAFGLQLRNSEHRGNWTLADVLREATVLGGRQDPARVEWLDLVRRATELQVAEPTTNP